MLQSTKSAGSCAESCLARWEACRWHGRSFMGTDFPHWSHLVGAVGGAVYFGGIGGVVGYLFPRLLSGGGGGSGDGGDGDGDGSGD